MALPTLQAFLHNDSFHPARSAHRCGFCFQPEPTDAVEIPCPCNVSYCRECAITILNATGECPICHLQVIDLPTDTLQDAREETYGIPEEGSGEAAYFEWRIESTPWPNDLEIPVRDILNWLVIVDLGILPHVLQDQARDAVIQGIIGDDVAFTDEKREDWTLLISTVFQSLWILGCKPCDEHDHLNPEPHMRRPGYRQLTGREMLNYLVYDPIAKIKTAGTASRLIEKWPTQASQKEWVHRDFVGRKFSQIILELVAEAGLIYRYRNGFG